MILRSQRYIISLILTLFLLVFGMQNANAQTTSKSGIINDYSKVTAVGVDWVELTDNTPGFNVNDKVLIIQMKGAGLKEGVAADGDYGSTIVDNVGDFGYYEFIVIDAVSTGPDRITFRNNLLGSYDPDSYVQLVKVPEYTNLIVDGLLTCPPWDEISGTGGVLTFLVDNNIYLNDNIDVSGKGFDGGISDIIQGLTITSANVDPDLLDFTEAVNKAARKGKGIGSHINIAPSVNIPFIYSDYARGKGRFGNGGGGGNGRFAGGGGGSSYGTGGAGGFDLDGTYGQGFPGEDPNTSWITSRYNPILMGGGGGAGGEAGGLDIASNGGNGGGIIIVLADSIFGNGNSIISNGESVPITEVADNDGGAGGGGAAGAIVISSNYNASSALTITANGGNGGNTTNFDGYGGGGSGGLIFTNTILGDFGIVTSVVTGKEGEPEGTSSGSSGQVSDSLLIRLNGFLFNTIVSDVTKSRVDSICEDESAPLVVGTSPVGGLPPYTFEWQKRTDNGSWAGLLPDTGKDLDLTVSETDTILIRRIVKDSGPGIDQIIDTSKAVTIIVQPLITGNTIGFLDGLVDVDTICYGDDPSQIIPLDVLGGGNFGSSTPDSTFWWGASAVNANLEDWLAAPGDSSSRVYDTTILNNTYYYYREVISGRCFSRSNTVIIEVLDSIEGNIISRSSPDTIACQDDLLTNLVGPDSGPDLTGGDNVYRFEWQWDNGTGFSAFGETNKDYDPDEATFTRDAPQVFRRIVYSGKNNRCVDISNVDTLLMWTSLDNNDLTSPDPALICQDDIPGDIVGSVPVFGDPGERIYTWEASNDDFTTDIQIVSMNGPTDYQPEALIQDTWFRRIVESSVCADTSVAELVIVQPKILNNNIFSQDAIADTALCFNGDPNPLLGTVDADMTGGIGAFDFEWLEKTTGNYGPATGTIDGITFDPGQLQETTTYARVVSSGVCEDTSAIEIVITIYPTIFNNVITPGIIECFGDPGSEIAGTGLSGGKPGDTPEFSWLSGSDPGNLSTIAGSDVQNYSPGNITQELFFQRIILSGEEDCCRDTSEVISVQYDSIQSDAYAGEDKSLVTYKEDVTLEATLVEIGEGTWSVVQSDKTGPDDFSNIHDENADVLNLGDGDNIFRWTVRSTFDRCPEKTDEVIINVRALNISSGFSPNGDPYNDKFVIEGFDDLTVKGELIITNLSGMVVYSNPEYHNEWDGQDLNSNPLPDGTYYYFLNITAPEERQEKGYVIIKRTIGGN